MFSSRNRHAPLEEPSSSKEQEPRGPKTGTTNQTTHDTAQPRPSAGSEPMAMSGLGGSPPQALSREEVRAIFYKWGQSSMRRIERRSCDKANHRLSRGIRSRQQLHRTFYASAKGLLTKRRSLRSVPARSRFIQVTRLRNQPLQRSRLRREGVLPLRHSSSKKVQSCPSQVHSSGPTFETPETHSYASSKPTIPPE